MSAPAPAIASDAKLSVQRQRKMRMGDEFKQMLGQSEALLIARYDGLTVAQMEELRAAVRSAGCNVKVVKKTVARRILADHEDFSLLSDQLQGQQIIGFAPSAPALAKVWSDFASDNEELKIDGGVMQGEVFDASKVAALAALPSREELLATLAGTLAAPVTKLARTLAAMPAGLARCLEAIRAKRDGEQN